ncbi:MAG TPA: MBL fold metallo-hydrolase [bacterium]|nr:MBL fold metallo-hydrolase [bacterium]
MNSQDYPFTISRLIVGCFQTNCYIVFSSHRNAVVIDPGDEEEKIIEYIKKEKLNVKYIINTHGHSDHIGANHIKNRLTPMPLLAIHQFDEVYLTDAALNLSEISGICYKEIKPDIILNDNQKIIVDENLVFVVLHTPGHTPGSISLKLNNYLFSGDLIFPQSVGRTDLPGGDEKSLRQSLKKIYSLDKQTIILPGHGEKTTLNTEIKTNPYLRLCL